MSPQPVPHVSAADVERITSRDFGTQHEAARLLIAEADIDVRVAVAALKLADGDLDQLVAALDLARIDWRDVIAAAEYRRYMALDKPDERDRVDAIAADWMEYQSWLSA